jgi:hypothetical protein
MWSSHEADVNSINMIANSSNIAHAIQLAIAPVFLLTAVAGLLNVLINRMARIIDRYRVIEQWRAKPEPHFDLPALTRELALLDRRAKQIHWAIGLCTSSAILVCAVNISLFVSSMAGLGLDGLISTIFILSSFLLLVGLICFLNEVRIATRSIYSISIPSAIPINRPKP